MANKLFGTKLFATALATFALASCQSENSLLEPAADNMREVTLTVTASKGDLTRTNLELSEDQKSVLLSWNLGDLIQVCEEDGRYAGTLQVTDFVDEEHTQAKFEGKVRMLDKDGTHNLAFYYLGTKAEYQASGGKQMPDMVYDLSAQTYTDVKALSAYDLLADETEVEVTKGNATFTSLWMKRQFAYGRFTLLYNDKPLVFDANTVVTINTEANDIKTGATIDFPSEITPAANGSISLTTSENDFYVTFVPGSSESKFKFNVIINGEEYEGYSNSYLVEKNDFYRKAQGLKVGEALPINVRKTDGSDDEHDFTLTYNANYGKNDTWNDNQKGVGFSYTYTLSEYKKIFDETNDGYEFTGWNTKADGTGESLVPNATLTVAYPDGAATVYAQWKKTVYDYTLNWETRDGDPIDTKTIQSDVDPYKWAVKYDNAFQSVPEGYEFAGWADKAVDPNTPVEEVTFTKDRMVITVVPVFVEKEYTWTVTWKDGYTENPRKQKTYTGKNGMSIEGEYPSDPTREGYTFAGWDRYVDTLSKSELEVVITAKWTKDDIKYVVTYEDGNNAELGKKEVTSKEDKVTVNVNEGAPSVTVPAGYEFLGWAIKGTTEVKSTVELTKDSKEVTVVPVFKKKPTVSTPGYENGKFN